LKRQPNKEIGMRTRIKEKKGEIHQIHQIHSQSSSQTKKNKEKNKGKKGEIKIYEIFFIKFNLNTNFKIGFCGG